MFVNIHILPKLLGPDLSEVDFDEMLDIFKQCIIYPCNNIVKFL